MPYFVWRGIDIKGSIQRGTSFARTATLLEAYLLRKEIALLSYRKPWFKRAFPLSRCAHYELADHLASLLESGVRLAEALDIVSKTTACPLSRAIVADCAQGIRDGMTLSSVLRLHVPLVDSLLIGLVEAGQESSALPKVLRVAAKHYALREELMCKLKSSLAMPAITFLFFLIGLYGLFYWIIPRFEALFALVQGPLPSTTKTLFVLSNALRAQSLFVYGLFVFGTLFCFTLFFRKLRLDLSRVAIIRTWYSLYQITLFLQSLAVLLSGGVHLAQALHLASMGISNRAIGCLLERIKIEVERGIPLSQALAGVTRLQLHEAEMLCRLGEATGVLPSMVQKAAELYEKKLYRVLACIATWIPPCVLVALGVMIGILIMGVYAPLLTLAQTIR